MTEQPKFLTAPETAELTRLTIRGLKALRARDDHGGLPHYRPSGGRILYREDEVRAWLEAGRVEAPDHP